MKRARFMLSILLVVALLTTAGAVAAEERDDPLSDEVAGNEKDLVDLPDSEEPAEKPDEVAEERRAGTAPDEDFVRPPDGAEIGITSVDDGAEDISLVISENEGAGGGTSPWVYGGIAGALVLLLGGTFVLRQRSQRQS